MTRPIDPAEFAASPEAQQIGALISDLLARRTDWGRQPRRRLIGEVELKQAIEALLAKMGEGATGKFWRTATGILAYTIAEFIGETWENGYSVGYKVGAAEPEPTLKSAAIAVGLPNDPWPTLEAFVEFYRERLTPPLTDPAGPWPLRDVLLHLAEAADILLSRHDYDGHGYEEIQVCRDRAREMAGVTPTRKTP